MLPVLPPEIWAVGPRRVVPLVIVVVPVQLLFCAALARTKVPVLATPLLSTLLNTSGWPQCAYMVTYTHSLKLTDGEDDDSGRGGVVAVFCKR